MEGFESQILPHLSAAYNLAMIMTRHEAAARDVVQDSLVKALKAWPAFKPGNAKAWLLTIIRRECIDYFRRTKSESFVDIQDEETMSDNDKAMLQVDSSAETDLIRRQDAKTVRAAIAGLTPTLREVIVLREMEDLAYIDIARLLEVPIGTVMSRLSRAREQLKGRLIATGAA